MVLPTHYAVIIEQPLSFSIRGRQVRTLSTYTLPYFKVRLVHPVRLKNTKYSFHGSIHDTHFILFGNFLSFKLSNNCKIFKGVNYCVKTSLLFKKVKFREFCILPDVSISKFTTSEILNFSSFKC